MIELSGICIEADTTAFDRGMKDAERAVARWCDPYYHLEDDEVVYLPPPKPLSLALTMIAAPGDRLALALIDRETGRPVEAEDISVSTVDEKTEKGVIVSTLVTVSVVVDVIPPFSVLVPPAAA